LRRFTFAQLDTYRTPRNSFVRACKETEYQRKGKGEITFNGEYVLS
jgi:hypothetical protein